MLFCPVFSKRLLAHGVVWLGVVCGLSGAVSARAQPDAKASPGQSVPRPTEHASRPLIYTARVTRVTDGDTLWVKPLAGGRYQKLRLDGVDAPEICQRGGPAAREALASRVQDQVVTVHVRAMDTYGRGLAQVRVGGEDLAAALVRGGHAWSYRWQHSQGPYAVEEAQARAERRGVFGWDGAEMPHAFRRRHGPCPLP